MNEVIRNILTRRSIRKYLGKPVPEDLVEEILKSAMAAPSAKNQQPWAFLVIRDRDSLNAIREFHGYSSMLKYADLAILVCGDMKQLISEDYWAQDCAAATQNMLLAAHSLGLGAVWLGVYPKERIISGLNSLFKLPSHIIPFSLVSIGYPYEEKPRVNRFDKTRIHINKW